MKPLLAGVIVLFVEQIDDSEPLTEVVAEAHELGGARAAAGIVVSAVVVMEGSGHRFLHSPGRSDGACGRFPPTTAERPRTWPGLVAVVPSSSRGVSPAPTTKPRPTAVPTPTRAPGSTETSRCSVCAGLETETIRSTTRVVTSSSQSSWR